MRRYSLAIVIVMLLAVPLMAQDTEVAKLHEATPLNTLGVQPATTPFSLLDMSRLRWSNSYSVSFFSGSGYSGSAGLWNSTMLYEFSSKLSMALNIGILHNTGAIWGNGNTDATILPGFMLDYHPSEKFRMTIGVSRQSSLLYPYFYPGRYTYGNSLFPY